MYPNDSGTPFLAFHDLKHYMRLPLNLFGGGGISSQTPHWEGLVGIV